MALHGQIQVNGQVLAWWQARRLTALSTDTPAAGQHHRYRWEVTDADTGRTWEGTLRHRYGNGAALLASNVLRAAINAGATLGPASRERTTT